MSSFDQEVIEEENIRHGVGSVHGSPPSFTPTMLASQAFALSKIEKRTDFEFEAEIDDGLQNSAQQNQERKLWKPSQQKLLLELHDEYGNKWTNIALQFPGRNHNSVKNHFYAQIRKSLRRINFFMKQNLSPSFKQLNINHISKMITMFSQKNEKSNSLPIEKVSQIQKLKRYLFAMGKRQQSQILQWEEIQEMKLYIQKINDLLEEVRKSVIVSRQQKKNKNKLIHFTKREKMEGHKINANERQDTNQQQLKPNCQEKVRLNCQQQSNSNCYVIFYCWNGQYTQYFTNFTNFNPTQQLSYIMNNTY